MAGGGGNSSSQDTSASSSTTSAPTSFYQQDPSYAGKAFTSGDVQPFVPASMYYQPRGAAPTPSATVSLPGFQNLRNAYYAGPTAAASDPSARVSNLLAQTNQYNQGYFNSMQQQKADMLQRAQAAAAAKAQADAEAKAKADAEAKAAAEQNRWMSMFQNNSSEGSSMPMAAAQGGLASLQGFER